LDTIENREVAGDAGFAFTHETLADVMQRVLAMPETERDEWRTKAMQRVRERYSWDAVTDAYEKLLTGLATKK
jgi:glycosyltransferase involved in cell wall biosynthesis